MKQTNEKKSIFDRGEIIIAIMIALVIGIDIFFLAALVLDLHLTLPDSLMNITINLPCNAWYSIAYYTLMILALIIGSVGLLFPDRRVVTFVIFLSFGILGFIRICIEGHFHGSC